jgi:hypothetical protein
MGASRSFLAQWPGRAAVLAARAYQKTLSPLIPVQCRFHPTCSQYFIEAVERHGFLRGLGLGLRRLVRCQPLCRGGHDPVP